MFELYQQLHLLEIATALIFPILFASLVWKNKQTLLTISTLLLIALQLGALVLRSIIGARAPVTNMYETVLWTGVGVLIVSTVLWFKQKKTAFLSLGLILNLACLMMLILGTKILNPEIKPLAPVLRNNFWLATHVTIITTSYALLALSWIIANYEMLRVAFSKKMRAPDPQINQAIYHLILWGVVLLSAGIILGGIWADMSWGRFWGWDPKETWSLISLLCYIAVLHGRSAGWIKPSRLAQAAALAFLSILMAWFGVNFILSSGLHSYGFSEGGAVGLLAVLGTQISVFVLRVAVRS